MTAVWFFSTASPSVIWHIYQLQHLSSNYYLSPVEIGSAVWREMRAVSEVCQFVCQTLGCTSAERGGNISKFLAHVQTLSYSPVMAPVGQEWDFKESRTRSGAVRSESAYLTLLFQTKQARHLCSLFFYSLIFLFSAALYSAERLINS